MFLLLILSTPVLLIWAVVRSFSNEINNNGSKNNINNQQQDDEQITNPIYSYLPCNIYHNNDDDNISGFNNDNNSSSGFNNDFFNNDF
jgi:hypothetical protein